MNKQPKVYLQTDPRWKNDRYSCNGGTMSIGGGGCGETSAAMLLTTLTGEPITPPVTMAWACDHGYVYANQGTSYDYFSPQFKAYGINCELLTWSKCLDRGSWVRYKVEEMLKEGYYFIALMTKGFWTKNGHYVVVWWEDDRVRINDPASTAYDRNNGDPDLFFSQAKYFWWVDARAYNNGGEDMDIDKLIESMTDEQAYKIYCKAEQHMATLPLPTNWNAREQLDQAIADGITDGSRPMCPAKRYEAALMCDRARGVEK